MNEFHDELRRLAELAYTDANKFDAHRKSLPEEYADWADEVARGMRDRVQQLRQLAERAESSAKVR